MDATHPALALIEFDSIAAGIEAGDAMVKRAPIARLVTGTVHPGRFLVMISGDVASVEESLAAGLERGSRAVLDSVFLPNVHESVVSAIAGERHSEPIAALGVIESATVASAIHAADAGIKGAEVSLVELRLADGLQGKGIVLFNGEVTDVEAAVEIGSAAVSPGQFIHAVVIPQLHGEMGAELLHATRFRENITTL